MAPSCQKKHNRTLSGIAFASNIDPEMFELMMRTTKQSTFDTPWTISS
jgi:hypothetical protein